MTRRRVGQDHTPISPIRDKTILATEQRLLTRGRGPDTTPEQWMATLRPQSSSPGMVRAHRLSPVVHDLPRAKTSLSRFSRRRDAGWESPEDEAFWLDVHMRAAETKINMTDTAGRTRPHLETGPFPSALSPSRRRNPKEAARLADKRAEQLTDNGQALKDLVEGESKYHALSFQRVCHRLCPHCQIWGKLLGRSLEQYEAALRASFAKLALDIEWQDMRPAANPTGPSEGEEKAKSKAAALMFGGAIHKAQISKMKDKENEKIAAIRTFEKEGEAARAGLRTKTAEVEIMLRKMELEMKEGDEVMDNMEELMRALTDLDFVEETAPVETAEVGTDTNEEDSMADPMAEELERLRLEMERQQREMEEAEARMKKLDSEMGSSGAQAMLGNVAKAMQEKARLAKLQKEIARLTKSNQAVLARLKAMKQESDAQKLRFGEEMSAKNEQLLSTQLELDESKRDLQVTKDENTQLHQLLQDALDRLAMGEGTSDELQAGLNAQLMALRKELERQQVVSSQLREDKEGLLARLVGLQGKLNRRQGHYESELARLRQALADSEQSRGRLQDQLDATIAQLNDGSDLAAKIAALQKQLAVLQEELDHAVKMANAEAARRQELERQLSELGSLGDGLSAIQEEPTPVVESIVLEPPVEMAMKECQTDEEMVVRPPFKDESGGVIHVTLMDTQELEALRMMAQSKDNKPQTAAPVMKLKPKAAVPAPAPKRAEPAKKGEFTLVFKDLTNSKRMTGQKSTLKLIVEILLKKVDSDRVDDLHGHQRQPLNSYILDFFIEKYGLQKLAKTHVQEFVTALRKYSKDHPRIKLFADLCGAEADPLPPHYTDFYVDVVSSIIRLAGLKTLNIDRSTADVLLPLQAATEVLELHFPTLNPQERELLEDTIIEKANIRRGEVPTTVSIDNYMQEMMEYYTQMMKDRETRLQTIFQQGDFNGDGQLSLDEFKAIVQAANMASEEQGVMAMFKQSLEESHRMGGDGDSITPQAFAKVALEYMLVSEYDRWKAKVLTEICDIIFESKGNLYNCFQYMDKDKSGTLDIKEFLMALQSGLAPTTLSFTQVEILMKSCDADSSGSLDYTEFIRRFQPHFAQMLRRRYGLDNDHIVKRICDSIYANRNTLKNAFGQMDVDGSGTISREEFEAAMRHLQILSNQDEIERVLSAVDKDNDGEISYEEFFYAFNIVDMKTFEYVAPETPGVGAGKIRHRGMSVTAQ